MHRSKTSPRRIIARQREREALALRTAGHTYERIAETMGVSIGTAYNCVTRALRVTVKEIAEEADKLRAQQLEQIRVGKAGIWQAYQDGAGWAVDRMVKLLDREARLVGLDLKPEVVLEGPKILVIESRPPWEREGGLADLPALPATTAVADEVPPDVPAETERDEGGTDPEPPAPKPRRDVAAETYARVFAGHPVESRYGGADEWIDI